ncbi:uncharacterized protein LOC113760009 [Coffea eugenioides]|uniref:uncharacterized protein LOC113760009 n=1 Tax=Coffea eugenioides TaxID=49369 RepID=UPI000F614A0E|nr:uncharacterized protein LOC113760009 [Coffea eugenioides]
MANREQKEEEVYPQTLIHILLDKYSKPIPLIAFFDTGAHTSIMRKDIIPDSYWIPEVNKFRGADGNLFETRFVTKNPITLKLLPDCCVSSKFLGANFTGKDLLLGFDLYRQNKYLITGNGIKSKKFFKPFIEIPKLYLIQEESVQQDQLQQFQKQIIQESCSTNHQEFLQKCDHPLWENSEFFIQLHFKKNEDINPTKASHSGMNPNDTKLAEQECQELLKFGLIEISHSQWACQAFYVNKRSEQLGIHPEDRHKTGFCIPNHHFQWKVMPFGLKTAPSLFQKVMIRIFQPILHSILVYIDDILLFSNTFEEHLELLKDFHHLVKQYGIMLSEKKMFLAQQEISFLGMKIAQGKCTPEQHVGQSIKDFPEDNLSKTQVQQFLGVVNYVREFLPKASKHISPLTKMLKKKPPPWGVSQTQAIQILKKALQDLPTLHIPSDGKKILQTDASDKYWGAVLLEEDEQGTKHCCGFASGKFKVSEQHYHSTFKEILAVKNGIKKFSFFLISHHFLVEMDMGSFPKMLHFKQNNVPNPQLLRWSAWFSQYSFEVKNIKGKKNIVADFFSRKEPLPQQDQPCFMFSPVCSEPPDIHQIPHPWEKEDIERIRNQYEFEIFSSYGGSILNPFGTNPEYPFCQIFIARHDDFPKSLLWKTDAFLLKYGLVTMVRGTTIQVILTGPESKKRQNKMNDTVMQDS